MMSYLVAAMLASPTLYGLDLVHNAPAQAALCTVDPDSGNVTVLGPGMSELFGMSDLVAIANGLFFYLGDTSAGATLVALDLKTGTKACSAHVDVAEIQFVGIGQSLDYDASTDTLLLSGVSLNRTEHVVYRGDASRTCGGFTKVGTYGLSDYLPMLHASTLDAAAQRLYVGLAPSSDGAALGVIDLTGKAPMQVFDEAGAPDLHDLLIGMHFDPGNGAVSTSSRLVGIIGGGGLPLTLHAFETVSATWQPALPLTNVPTTWSTLGGNSGVVSTLDAASRALYFLSGEIKSYPNGTQELLYSLAAVDIDTAALRSPHPPVQKHCKDGYCDSLLALEALGDEGSRRGRA